MATRIIRIIRVAGATAAMVFLAVAGARAQSSLEVPLPGAQQPPRVAPTPASPPPASNPGYGPNVLQVAPPQPPAPAAPPPPPPPEAAAPLPPLQLTAPLPAVFRGCWKGQVNELDSIQRLPGAHKVGFWTPKTYRLCYRRVGGAPFTLTFSETGVTPTDKIINVRGEVVALSTDGRAFAKMRSDLHFDEYYTDRGLRGTTFAVDEVTMLDCRIKNDQMFVSAEVHGTRDGEPWFRAYWHAGFRQVAQ